MKCLESVFWLIIGFPVFDSMLFGQVRWAVYQELSIFLAANIACSAYAASRENTLLLKHKHGRLQLDGLKPIFIYDSDTGTQIDGGRMLTI